MGVNDFINIGQRIKKARLDAGYKQKDFANKLEIPVSTLANYEGGKREPNKEMIEKIASNLNLDVLTLIEFGSYDLKCSYLDDELKKSLQKIHEFDYENGEGIEAYISMLPTSVLRTLKFNDDKIFEKSYSHSITSILAILSEIVIYNEFENYHYTQDQYINFLNSIVDFLKYKQTQLTKHTTSKEGE